MGMTNNQLQIFEQLCEYAKKSLVDDTEHKASDARTTLYQDWESRLEPCFYKTVGSNRLKKVKEYKEGKAIEDYSPDDWMKAADRLFHTGKYHDFGHYLICYAFAACLAARQKDKGNYAKAFQGIGEIFNLGYDFKGANRSKALDFLEIAYNSAEGETKKRIREKLKLIQQEESSISSYETKSGGASSEYSDVSSNQSSSENENNSYKGLISDKQLNIFNCLYNELRAAINGESKSIEEGLKNKRKDLYGRYRSFLEAKRNRGLGGALAKLKSNKSDEDVENWSSEQWLNAADNTIKENTGKLLICYAYAACLAIYEGEQNSFKLCFSKTCDLLQKEAFTASNKGKQTRYTVARNFLCDFIQKVAELPFEGGIRKAIGDVANDLAMNGLINDLLDEKGKIKAFESSVAESSTELSMASWTSSGSSSENSSTDGSSNEESEREKSLYLMSRLPDDLLEHKQARDILIKKDGCSYEIYRIPSGSKEYDTANPISIDEEPNDDATIKLKRLLDQVELPSDSPYQAHDLLGPVKEFIKSRIQYSNLLKVYNEFHESENTFLENLKKLQKKLLVIKGMKKPKIPNLMNDDFFQKLTKLLQITEGMENILRVLSTEASSKDLATLKEVYKTYRNFFKTEYRAIICYFTICQKEMMLLHSDFMGEADTALDEVNDAFRLKSLFYTVVQRLPRHKGLIGQILELTESLDASKLELAETQRIVEEGVKKNNEYTLENFEVHLGASKGYLKMQGDKARLDATEILEGVKIIRAKYRKELQESSQQRSELQQQLKEAQSTSSELEAKLEESQLRTTELQQELAEQRTSAEQAREEYASKLGQLQTQLQGSKDETAAQSGEVERLSKDIEQIQSQHREQLEEASQQRSELQQQLKEAQSTSSELEAKLEESQLRTTELQQELAEQRTSAEQAREEYASKLGQLQTQLQGSKDETAAQSGEVERLSKDIEQIQSQHREQLEEASHLRSDLERQLEEAQSTASDKDLERQLEEKRIRNATLLEDENTQLKKDLIEEGAEFKLPSVEQNTGILRDTKVQQSVFEKQDQAKQTDQRVSTCQAVLKTMKILLGLSLLAGGAYAICGLAGIGTAAIIAYKAVNIAVAFGGLIGGGTLIDREVLKPCLKAHSLWKPKESIDNEPPIIGQAASTTNKL